MRVHNLSFILTLAPKHWSVANILPIFKRCYTGHPISFRPGNPIFVLSKLVETVMMKELLNA